MRRHPFDPLSFVFGLLFVALSAVFLTGDRTAADLGSLWPWVPVVLVGLFMVMYGVARLVPRRADIADETEQPDEPARKAEPG